MENAAPNRLNPALTHLAEQYILRKGYRPVVVPEAEALREYCDILLTYSDGLGFYMMMMSDKDSGPHKSLTITPEVLEAVAIACGKYTGKVNRVQMPVVINVMRVGHHADSAEERQPLAALKKRVAKKYTITAWDVATESGTVWSSLPFNGKLAGTKFIQSVLKTPRMTPEEIAAQQNVVFQEERKPLVTWALLAVMALVFMLEIAASPDGADAIMSVDIPTLIKMGGWARDFAVEFHQWFRLLTPAFLHGGILHIAMNGFVLYIVGPVLEGFIGRAWMLGLFFLGALSGALMSWAVNDASIVSVGASGAIMALIAATYILSFRLPPGTGGRTSLQTSMMQILIPSLLPLATSHMKVDVAAHIGGAISGGIMGYLLLKAWSRTAPLPGARWLPGIFSLGCMGVLAFGALQLWQSFGSTVIELQ